MEHYVPPYCPPCELYWQALLAEGPVSYSASQQAWEWVEAPTISLEVWEEGELVGLIGPNGTAPHAHRTGYR